MTARQVIQCGNQTLQLEEVFILRSQSLLQPLQLQPKNSRVFAGIDRETMLKVEDAELALLPIEFQLEFTAVQDRAVLISQNWYEHLAPEFLFQRFPIDIEEFGITRGLAIFQDIQPPGIVTAHNAHVVGNDIQNLPHAMLVERVDELIELLRSPNFRIQTVVVDDVVSVSAARPGSQIR